MPRPRFATCWLVTTCAWFAIAAPSAMHGARADEVAADLPIQRVVMFNSGVAFFEHAGDVQGNATVDLTFNVRDINDLLKSMVLQDLGGGRISTVSYGSKEPITRTLKTFAIDLTANPTLANLLSQVRGEQVEVEAPSKITGIILGVETRKQPAGKDQTVDVQYLNLLTPDGLHSVALASVGRIKLTNPKLDAELRQALSILATSHDTDKKKVSLNFLGQGKRAVRVGYIQESPVWKTSYRLVLSDNDPPFLQGWAIVENTTEADWKDVRLSLVSGRPISFIMDLYEPLYVGRPVVMPELYASLRPRVYDQDLAGADMDFRQAADQAKYDELAAQAEKKQRAIAPAGPPAAATPGRGAYLAEGEANRLALKDAGVRSVAQAADVGEMFQYHIATPVTLARQQSAMLPIVNESVSGEKISIYNASVHAKHPLNGLKMKNATELHLMQGPVTVFDDGAYAGDAQIQDLPPGTERIISYAMDLDTEVAPTSKGQPDELLSVRIAKGTLYATRKYGRTQSYVIKNSGKKTRKVLVEYPLDTAWTLVAPKEPAEKTRDLYRFAVSAEPGKPAALDIHEERTASESVLVTNLPDGMIVYYLNAKVVSDGVKAALRDVVKRKADIAAAVQKRQELERQIAVIDQEQNRIRQNMVQLPKDSDLFRRYVQKFTEQEDGIENLREQVTAALAEETRLRKALDDYLLGMNLT
jgi:hypothetical protein